MQSVILILGGLFGLLSLYGAGCQLRDPRFRAPCGLMAVGSVIFVLALIGWPYGLPWMWLAALAGSVIICAAAYWNGKRCGAVNPLHHVIRIAFCALMVAGIYFY